MRENDQYLRNESGPMNKFWQQYLDILEILFDFRKSVRDGNWNLRIAASERMLKWFSHMIAQTTQGTLRFIGQINLICHKAILICSENFKKAILVSEGFLGSSTASQQIKLLSRQSIETKKD